MCQSFTLRGSFNCPGDAMEKRTCNSADCPVLSPWTEWTECSKTCGTGERSRQRICDTRFRSTQNPCKEELFEREVCNTEECPIYTEWSEWSQCSTTCGGGSQKRSRSCVQPKYSNKVLICKDGPPEETR